MEEIVVAKVLRDFLTVTDGELSITKGDIVQVLRKVDRHWCYGCSAGKFGNFPSNILMEIDTPSFDDGQELFVALANFQSQQAGDLSFAKGDVIVGIQQVDDNWWQGMIDERVGIFPVTYTWMLNSVDMKARRMSQSLNLKAVVKMNMAAKLEDEMDLYQGEMVTITQIIDKNWYSGFCKDRSGTFPSAYVQLIDEPKECSQSTSDNTTQHCNTSESCTTPPLILFSPLKENKPKPVKTSHDVDLNDVFNDDYFKLNMPTMYQQQTVTKTEDGFSSKFKDDEVQSEEFDSSLNVKCSIQTSGQVDIVSYGLTLYPFHGQFENELSFHEGEIIELIRHVDSLWMEGTIDERRGIFPTNYISILVDCDERPSVEQEPHSLPATLATNSFAIALYNFDAQMNGDLTVRKNQVVLVLNQIDDDWCQVKDQNGNAGLCPRNHLTSHSIPGDYVHESSKHDKPSSDDQFVKDVNSAKFQRSKSISVSRADQPFSSKQQNRHSHSPSSVASVRPIRRQGSDHMPHRPAPPTPVPGQQPVRRTLKQPTFSQPGTCSAVVEEKCQKEEPVCYNENAQALNEDQRKKNLEQRQNVISELVFTEKEYIRDLKITYETFNLYNPSMLESRGIDVKILFGNILEIMHLAENFLDSLMLAMKGKDDEDQCVGPCFLTMADEMKRVYGQYCVNHDNALALLEKYETNQEIQNVFEKGLETLRYQIACFNMGSILIKPVQRILKYPLILNELIKSTEDGHKDKRTLLEAVRSVTEVATSINEEKRRKDIVCKYLEDGNTTIASKMSKLSLHSVAKKSSRLSVMLTSSLGFGNATKDPVFDEYECMFHALEKSVGGFIQNVELFLSHQHEEIMMQTDVAECIGHFYQEANIVAVDQFLATQQLIVTNFWSQFRNMVDARVFAPLNTLLELFHGPSILVQKRNDKLLDYNGCIAKAEKNKENKLIQDELFAAKNNYEALNTHLLEELPSLIQLSTEIFIECLSAFIAARKLFSGKTTKEYLSLMEGHVIMQFHGDPLESFSVKHSLVLNQMARFTFTSKGTKTDTLGKRVSKTSPTPFRNISNEANNSQVEVTRNPSHVNNQPQVRVSKVSPQSHSQRVYLQSRYNAGMIHQVVAPHIAREPLELTMAFGHIVAVIKKQNPMGDSTIWFVDDGAIKGFVPSSCLSPISSSGAGTVPSATESTTPRTSRKQLPRLVPPVQNTERPPSYEQVVNNTYMTTESPELTEQPLYAEIPDSPPQAEFYYAMFDFMSNGPHSLTIKSGQVVNVLQKQDLQGNTEWWLVEDRFGGKGYVPGNFLGKYG